MVHELGICVFVCIFVVSLCAFEGFVYLHSGGGGGGGAFSWAFYGCFVCILVNFATWWVSKYYIHNIRLWHHVAYIFAARMAEYISAFRYILNK